MERECEFAGCGASLEGKRADARFCGRAHKQAAVRLRERIAAGDERHEICDTCHQPYLGFPPYCDEHRTEGSAP